MIEQPVDYERRGAPDHLFYGVCPRERWFCRPPKHYAAGLVFAFFFGFGFGVCVAALVAGSWG